jgi:tRNA nucleotidyltransferase (CCA-adding enzyme)
LQFATFACMRGKIRVELGRNILPWERSILEEGDLYLVGGIVRDLLMGLKGDFLDADYLAAGLEPDRLVSILNRFGKTNLVGKSFGVVKFTTPEGRTVDISLPRTEFSTGPMHRDFKVRYDISLPIEKDLERRDFTINSMACHLENLRLIDPLGGRKDLENRLLKVNRSESFREDPLRILRGIQFLARFDLRVDDKTSELMRRDKDLLSTVSPERIREELNKMLLRAKNPGDGFVFMHETGILNYVLPELEETCGMEQNEYHPDDLFTHSIKSCNAAVPDLLVRWSALLHDLGKREMKQEFKGRIVFYRHEERSAFIAEEVLSRLRFPGAFTERVVHLVRHHMFHLTEEWSDAAVRRFIARVGSENLEDLFALREADALSRGDRDIEENLGKTRDRVRKLLESETTLKRKDLVVDGNDVMKLLKIEAGPEIGKVLQKLLDMVIENPEFNTREKLVEVIKSIRGLSDNESSCN